MKELPPRVYMFFGEAVSDSPDSGYPEGERHAVVAFAMANDIDTGARVAADHFLDAGWTSIEFSEGEVFDLDRLEGVDDDVAATCRKCAEDGSSGIVFGPAIEE